MSSYYMGTEDISRIANIITEDLKRSYLKNKFKEINCDSSKKLYIKLCELNNFALQERYGDKGPEIVAPFEPKYTTLDEILQIQLIGDYLYQCDEGQASNEKLMELVKTIHYNKLESFFNKRK